MQRHVSEQSKRGFVVFFTGYSGAGKSTLAAALKCKLQLDGKETVHLLDDSMFRFGLSPTQDHARGFRESNTLRIAVAAAALTQSGSVALCSSIAPSEKVRSRAREIITSKGQGKFFLVYLCTALGVCEQRDIKGLYLKARLGQIDCLTGITDPYEKPCDAELTIDTVNLSVDEVCDVILASLIDCNLVEHRAHTLQKLPAER